MNLQVAAALDTDVAELADLAAATFPLACPPSAAARDVAAFVAENLSPQRFTEYLVDPDRAVLLARDGTTAVGYAMVVAGVGEDPDVARSVTARPAAELSKMYVLPEWHGSGVSAALMAAAVGHAADTGARCLWLGVNQKNERAQRFYRKHGFAVVGARTFQLGGRREDDFVMARPRLIGGGPMVAAPGRL